VTFAGLVEAMRVVSQYWFEIVELPEVSNLEVLLVEDDEEDYLLTKDVFAADRRRTARTALGLPMPARRCEPSRSASSTSASSTTASARTTESSSSAS